MTTFWLKYRARKHLWYAKNHRLHGRHRWAVFHLNIACGYTRSALIKEATNE